MLFLVCLLDSVRCYFWCFADSPRVTRRGSSSGGGQIYQNAAGYPLVSYRYPIFSVNACIYSTFAAFLMSTPWGLPPNPLSLARPQGQVAKPNHLPLRWCWVASKASRVKDVHSFAALCPFSSSVKIAKRSETDGAGNLSRLAKQPLAAWVTGWATTLCGKGCRRFSLPPAVANASVGSAHGVWQDPWGSRGRGQCAVGTHFKGFGG